MQWENHYKRLLTKNRENFEAHNIQVENVSDAPVEK